MVKHPHTHLLNPKQLTYLDERMTNQATRERERERMGVRETRIDQGRIGRSGFASLRVRRGETNTEGGEEIACLQVVAPTHNNTFATQHDNNSFYLPPSPDDVPRTAVVAVSLAVVTFAVAVVVVVVAVVIVVCCSMVLAQGRSVWLVPNMLFSNTTGPVFQTFKKTFISYVSLWFFDRQIAVRRRRRRILMSVVSFCIICI